MSVGHFYREKKLIGTQRRFVIAIACGAINSSVLLLKSANEKHPNGLANSSGLVGRNFMKHLLGSIIGV